MWKLSWLTAGLFLLGSTAVLPQGSGDGPRGQLAGMVYHKPSPAPDFLLMDQHGSRFRMAQTRGKVVVLTFIYTHCTDVCPFVSLKLKQARALLGKDADRVAFVAVSTDPARDTTPVIAAYSREAGLFEAWHFLTGPVTDVQAVWNSYHIGAEIEKQASSAGQRPDQPDRPESEHAQGLKAEDLRLAGRIIQRFGGGYEVTHTVPFWIIDQAGDFRALLDADASPRDIAGDARLLLAESRHAGAGRNP
jgi:cytochrome oxidase Cu insertion factor (SCO1/SenC/PrrC family)